MKKNLSLALSLVVSLALSISLVACAGAPASSVTSVQSSPSANGASSTPAAAGKPTQDRAGISIELPDTIHTIVVLAPSITEMVVALGESDKMIAIDTQSALLETVFAKNLPVFDMVATDVEQLAALNPDLVLVSPMSAAGGEDPFTPLADLGICVASIPTSENIQSIEDDIAFVAAVLGKQAEGAAIISNMQAEIAKIAAIGNTITDKKTVYFELAAAPYAYSFGSGVFLNEMLEIIGAENIFAAELGWISVETEAAIAANPNVILTNVNYIENPVDEILGREGWGEITAIKNKDVHYIDNLSSSLPDQNIVLALQEMARAVYPALYP